MKSYVRNEPTIALVKRKFTMLNGSMFYASKLYLHLQI